MSARIEAVFFGLTAFLITAQILAGFASIANPAPLVANAGRQLRDRASLACTDPTAAPTRAEHSGQTKNG